MSQTQPPHKEKPKYVQVLYTILNNWRKVNKWDAKKPE